MNLRPPGYEPDELPSCSTPRHSVAFIGDIDYYTLFQQFCQEGAESFFAAEAEDENAAADLLSRKPAATLYWFYLGSGGGLFPLFAGPCNLTVSV